MKNPYAQVQLISTNSLTLFASGGTQSAVASLNGSIATHNAAVTQWESEYSTATSAECDPTTAIATAASLSSQRLALAVEAATLLASKIALRATIRADYQAAPAPTQRAASQCGLPALDEAAADTDESNTIQNGLALCMAAAIG